MKKCILMLGIMVLGLLYAAPASAKTNVFACEPEWGALAEIIGKEHVSVSVATTAKQNVHHLRAKPSLLAKMRQADLVFCNGASLEIGWLPLLLQKAGGPKVQPGQAGHLLAAKHVKMLGVPAVVDRSMGDVHPEGNPHVLGNPHNIAAIADVLAERLATIDSTNASAYTANLAAFKAQWNSLIKQWELQGQNLKSMKVVVYHTNWTYLLDWLGIDAVASLEPKPGIPPTASHLESVLQTVKAQDVKAVLVAPFEDEKAAQWLSERTGIPVLALPFTVGGNAQAENLEALFHETLRLLQEVQL